MFKDHQAIKDAGFTGFKTVTQLWNDHSVIPDERGIYLVLNSDCSKCGFLDSGSGGYFKGKNPNVELEKLTNKWIPDCHILYIGKAGGEGSGATLRKRLKQYLDFGKGKPVGHYGGRFIWQIQHHPELIIAWRVTRDLEPRAEESRLISEFIDHYGKLPFANLTT